MSLGLLKLWMQVRMSQLNVIPGPAMGEPDAIHKLKNELLSGSLT